MRAQHNTFPLASPRVDSNSNRSIHVRRRRNQSRRQIRWINNLQRLDGLNNVTRERDEDPWALKVNTHVGSQLARPKMRVATFTGSPHNASPSQGPNGSPVGKCYAANHICTFMVKDRQTRPSFLTPFKWPTTPAQLWAPEMRVQAGGLVAETGAITSSSNH